MYPQCNAPSFPVIVDSHILRFIYLTILHWLIEWLMFNVQRAIGNFTSFMNNVTKHETHYNELFVKSNRTID